MKNANATSTCLIRHVRKLASFFIISGFLFLPFVASADIHYVVPAASIQAAVNDAIAGDVVQVAAGTYVLSATISVPDGITVRGAGAGATIVDGNNAVRCFSLTSNAVVAEMTVMRGSADYGGGVYGGIVSNCVLTGNSAKYSGGGAQACTLYNCTLTGNSAAGGDTNPAVAAVRWAAHFTTAR